MIWGDGTDFARLEYENPLSIRLRVFAAVLPEPLARRYAME